jgi:polyphosphate kinase
MELSSGQAQFVDEYFQKKVRQHLVPINIRKSSKFKHIKDDAIYLVAETEKKDDLQYHLIEIPTDTLPRFVLLPKEGDRIYIILLDDVIRRGMKGIFNTVNMKATQAFTIKITRDAELDLNDDLSESYYKKVAKGLEQRKEGYPVRFVYDAQMPSELVDFMAKKLNLTRDDAFIGGGRYHNFKDFISFPKVGSKELTYDSWPTIAHPDIKPNESIMQVMREKDILLHFPYHSFDPVIDLLREAAIDPKVREIMMTVYRVAGNSSIMNALLNAARNGKEVTVVIELRARFDEKANMKWSTRLQEAGAKVIFGVPGLKVHSKLIYIGRKEEGTIRYYGVLGTGNFNESTAGIFSDHQLFTANRFIVTEIGRLFEFFKKNYQTGRFPNLLVSPFNLRTRVTRMINQEIRNARQGKKAMIQFKVNNLSDPRIIYKLYEAHKAGVEVRINVRGMFAMLADIPELGVKMEYIGIIDKFLEHSRVYHFYNDGNEKLYISSADIMERNMDRRVEVACPILDPALRDQIKTMLEMQWRDNVSVRVLDNDLKNDYRPQNEEDPFRSQEEFYKYIYELSTKKD